MTFQECVKLAKRNQHKKFIMPSVHDSAKWQVIGRNMAKNCLKSRDVYGPINNYSAPVLSL